MSGPGQETRPARRRRVERLVASGMDVAQWCELNKVSKPALYSWMRVFRDEEPDLFGGAEVARAGDGHRNWYEHVRKAMRTPAAIEPAGASGLAAAAPAFAVVDTASISAGPPQSKSYMRLFAGAACDERPVYVFERRPTRGKSVLRSFLDGWQSGSSREPVWIRVRLAGDMSMRWSCADYRA